MPFNDFLSSLLGLNDPYKKDRDMLAAQIQRMEDPYKEDRDELEAQIERMNKPSWFSQTPLGQDLAPYIEEGKLQLPFEPGPAIAGIAEKRERIEEPVSLMEDDDPYKADRDKLAAQIDRMEDKERQEKLDKLIAAGQQASEQRQFMQGTTPLYEDYEKGIAVGGDPNKSKEEILAKIRAQAAKMGGMDKPSPGGGGFTQAEMTPEIAARLGANDAWASGQDIRDAQFAMSREQAEMRPRQAAAASQRLLGLKEQASDDRRNKMIEAIVSRVGRGGKLPYEEAARLRQLGLPIDVSMIGQPRESGVAYFNALQQEAGKFLSGIDPITLQTNPALQNRVDIERIGALLAQEYERKVASGQMTVEQARDEYEQFMSQFIMSKGFGNLESIQAEQQSIGE